MGLILIAKVIVMLVVSFFILVTVTKIKSKELQQFGKLLALTIWILSAFMIISLLANAMYGATCRKSKMGFKAPRRITRTNIQPNYQQQ